MSDQLGFDFCDTLAPVFAEAPAGTWTAPLFTPAQYVERFAKAEAALLGIVGPGRVLMRQGIDAAKAQHEAMQARGPRDADDAYSLWRSNFEPSADELAAFVTHCETMAGGRAAFPGIEYKTRRRHRGTYTVAMHVQDLGTVIVRHWHAGGVGVDFHLYRDAFFLDSIRDDVPALFAPVSVWASAYCADKLAYSDAGTASVPTFTLNGREYINDGGMGAGDYRECEGWTFRPLADWTGPTYSYRTQCRAWDDGRLERGDRRGLVVSVRGQRCVLDGVVIVYDDNASAHDYTPAEDDGDELPEDAEGEADELDELAA